MTIAMMALTGALLIPQAARAFPADFGPGFTTRRVSVDGDTK